MSFTSLSAAAASSSKMAGATISQQDVIFAEAGCFHRFEAFFEDFAAWVIFWGREGGES